jgi:hypothetical protein
MSKPKPIDEQLKAAVARLPLPDLMALRSRVGQSIDALEIQKNTYDAVAIPRVLGDGLTKYADPEGRFTASVQKRTTRTISREALIAQGVPVEKIDAATKDSTSEPYLVFRQTTGADEDPTPA